MAWRKTGQFRAPQEVMVMTCDTCSADIGYEDGRRPKAHYEIQRLPNVGAMDYQEPPALICSVECLRAFAAGSPDPGRAPRRQSTPAVPPKI